VNAGSFTTGCGLNVAVCIRLATKRHRLRRYARISVPTLILNNAGCSGKGSFVLTCNTSNVVQTISTAAELLRSFLGHTVGFSQRGLDAAAGP